jgi:hypothetical protein
MPRVKFLSSLPAHVVLCLLPAFFIAGAMTALIPKEAITRAVVAWVCLHLHGPGEVRILDGRYSKLTEEPVSGKVYKRAKSFGGRP